MRYGMIGCGSMGGAIVKGAVTSGLTAGSDWFLSGGASRRAADLADAIGANFTADAAAVAREVDVLILGVKPQVQPGVLAEVSGALRGREGRLPIVVSIAAGRTIASIESALGAPAPVVRVMPNVGAEIGASVSGVCAGAHATAEDLQTVVKLFESVGATAVITEDKFGVFSAIAGCSPAWITRLIDALAQAAVAHGLPKAQATAIAAAAVSGTGQLVTAALERGEVPANVVDKVCSPGGTTVAGLLAMEDAGFSRAVRAGVNAAIKRDAELA